MNMIEAFEAAGMRSERKQDGVVYLYKGDSLYGVVDEKHRAFKVGGQAAKSF